MPIFALCGAGIQQITNQRYAYRHRCEHTYIPMCACIPMCTSHTYNGEWEDKKAGAVSEGVQGAEGQTHLVKCISAIISISININISAIISVIISISVKSASA